MGTLYGQVSLEECEEDSVPNGPQSVQMEASFSAGRLAFSDSHASIWWTILSLPVLVSLDHATIIVVATATIKGGIGNKRPMD